MNRGMFAAQINNGWRLLHKLNLGEQRRETPQYSGIDNSEFRDKSYIEKWQVLYTKRLFDFQLIDGALVQFRALGDYRKFVLNYVYYDCPYDILTYKDYLKKVVGTDYAEARDYFRQEYEEYIFASNLKKSVTPIRYDFDVDAYEEAVHPSSHVHIGDENKLRIGTEKVWKPISFLLFIVRQCYPEEWKNLIKIQEADIWAKNVRDNLEEAPFVLEGRIDKMEIVLA